MDATRRIAQLAADGRLEPRKLTEERFRQLLDEPDIPDVDLFVRSSGEQRTSNFLLWQSAYAELVFLDRLWPDFDRRDLWRAIELYAGRDRQRGGAAPTARRAIAGMFEDGMLRAHLLSPAGICVSRLITCDFDVNGGAFAVLRWQTCDGGSANRCCRCRRSPGHD